MKTLKLILLFFILIISGNTSVFAEEFICNTVAEIETAMSNAIAGDTILIEAGTYTSYYFETGNAGTASNPIVIASQDPDNQATLRSSTLNGGIVCEINHEYWVVKNLKFENASKGIVLNNASYSIVDSVTVYNTGQEGIHIINGTSDVQILNSKVYNCGLVTADYGEAVYVGSDKGKWDQYNRNCHDNIIKGCILGPGVTAEHVDIKEGTLRTIVEECIFYGEGISGANSADSFIDAKGDSAIIRNNIGFREKNNIITAAFETHKKVGDEDGDGDEDSDDALIWTWGKGNIFTCNKLYLNLSNIEIINATSGAIAGGNTKYPAGGLNYFGTIIDTTVTCTETDCIGVEGGTASIDDCDVCSGGTTGIAANSSCEQDCNGVWDGTASIDNCGDCTGGNTGLTACVEDCNGDWGGTAEIDKCDVCSGGNTGIAIDDCPSSIETITLSDEMVYPIPAKDKLMFSDYITNNYNQIIIYNTVGQIVLSNTLSNELDISKLNLGLYFAQFSKDGEVSSLIKVVKE